jgi:hypothetical protein
MRRGFRGLGLGRGRPPFANIHREGVPKLAHDIGDRVWAERAQYHCWVLDDGFVIVRQTNETRYLVPPDHCLVGTYTRKTRIAHIAEDLAERLRELNAQAIAA